MKHFARLLDALVFQPSRNGKVRLIEDYFATVPDPDRGYALAALTGTLSFSHAKPAVIRQLAADRIDPQLFRWSYDFVGDLAETVALIWPERPQPAGTPGLTAIVQALQEARRSEVPGLLSGWLDGLDGTGRWALLKLITGGLRVGVSARLAKTALASYAATRGGSGPADQNVHAIEEVWHGLEPPYEALFAWLDGRGAPPDPGDGVGFRPMMLANPIDGPALSDLDPADFAAEWKWDGARVQLAAHGGQRRLYSRSGDEISAGFPDIIGAMDFDAVLDGELLIADIDAAEPFSETGPFPRVAAFNALQARLNRKTVAGRMLEERPAFVRVYDILFDAGEDLRGLPVSDRRRRLEAFFAAGARCRLDISPLIPFADWEMLAELRAATRENGIEGVMLKRRDSIYVAGRPKGPWYKWKRNPLLLDVVLMYAQRGHGKRSSFYSDFTFGAWDGEALVPVGKAYFGFTDDELRDLDRWVRNNTVRRYGPVREVAPGLVLEVAFDSVHPSRRHKSGVAMRFPRIHRIRWDKPATEADRLSALEALMT